MKKNRVNPTAIGLFALGAVAIAIVSVVLFGSGRWFGGERASFVCFFEDDVDGMQIGSKVKLKGVPIGEVKRILLRFKPKDGEGGPRNKALIPVIIEVDIDRLTHDLGVDLGFEDDQGYRAQIDDGLRASLGVSSLITGILQVNLDYHQEAKPAENLAPFIYRGEVYRVIPTLPSQLAQATSDLLGVVNNISQADFKGVIDGLNEVLDQISEKLEQFEVKGMNAALTAFQERMDSPKFDEALDAFSKAADAVADATQAVQDVADNLNRQLSEDVLGSAVTSADRTFDRLRTAVDSLNEMITANQEVPEELEGSLKQVGSMAEAIRELAAYLTEHPNALIFGRRKGHGEGEDPPAEPEKRTRKPWRAGPRS